MEMIAGIISKHNVICISDEVYEWLVYPGNDHIRIGKKNLLHYIVVSTS